LKIGVMTSHLYGLGGGFRAVWWHVLALLELGNSVVVLTRNRPHPIILNNWLDHVPLRWYVEGCERDFDCVINIDHFVWAQPLAKDNIAHIFFPMREEQPPPENVRLYSNSEYTRQYIEYRWGRKAQTLYIPIKGKKALYPSPEKDRLILHVSRFSEPSAWADKGHRQMIQVFRMYQSALSRYRLIMAGGLDPQQENYLDELMVTASGLPIDFLVNLPDSDLAELYRKAAFYWHCTGISVPAIPSAQEHLGLAPLEAQACGAVPIVFRSGGMPEVVRDGVTGALFDDARQMGQLTANIANNLSLWSTLSQHAVRWAESWQDFDSFVIRVACMLAGSDIPPLPSYVGRLRHKPEQVTAVIPTYNNQDMLGRCLESLSATVPDMNVITINNGDSISLPPLQDNWKLIDAGNNLGFAGAHRLAETLVETPLVLLLNDDVEAQSRGWLELLLFELNDPLVGVVGPKLTFPYGNLQHAGGLIDWNREDIGFHRWYGQNDHLNANLRCEVDFVTGACMLLRKELYHIEDYLLDLINMEDAEICMNARQRGYKVVYQPASSLVHHEGNTKRRLQNTGDKITTARAKFKEKWHGKY